MTEYQLLRVQQHAMDAAQAKGAVAPTVTVTGVANQVVIGMLEVTADLAKSPGLRATLEQGVARARKSRRRLIQLALSQYLKLGDGGLLMRFPRPAIEWVVDRESCFGRPTPTHGQIHLLHLT